MATQKSLWGVKLPEGCEVEHDNGQGLGRHRANLDAPPGMVWNTVGLHCVVVYTADDVRHEVNHGFSKCEDPDCEYCFPE